MVSVIMKMNDSATCFRAKRRTWTTPPEQLMLLRDSRSENPWLMAYYSGTENIKRHYNGIPQCVAVRLGICIIVYS